MSTQVTVFVDDHGAFRVVKGAAHGRMAGFEKQEFVTVRQAREAFRNWPRVLAALDLIGPPSLAHMVPQRAQLQQAQASRASADADLDHLAKLVAARSALRGLEKVAQTYESNHAARMVRVRAMIQEQRDKVAHLVGVPS